MPLLRRLLRSLALPLPRLRLFRRLDLPLSHDASGRFLSWIVGLMVFLAMLAAAGAMTLSALAGRWDSGLTGTLTAQVAALQEGAPPLAERQEAALGLLRQTSGVIRAELVPVAEIKRLLAPWLGEGPLATDLPLPALIDITLSTPGAVNIRELGTRLAASIPGARLDDHVAWLADLARLASTLQLTAVAIMALVAASAVLAVVYSVRTGLAVHHEVVELLHLMGATDAYIAEQFQTHVLVLAARGGGVGFVAAMSALVLIGIALRSFASATGLMPGISLAWWQWASLGLVPLATVLLAAMTAHITVRRALAEMP